MKLLRNTLLETFVTVVECGGFSDAQYALGITQSAISIRIRDLETSLGYRLCERGRGGFRLTERGEIAYQKARDILRSARDFDAELLELRDTIAGDLRIGIVDAIASLPGLNLAGALHRFFARPNEVRVEIVVASPTDLTQQLISGELNAAVAPFRNQVPELEYIELCSEEHRLYCAQRHPLFGEQDSEISLETIGRHQLCQRSYDMLVSPDLGSPEPKAVVANMEAMAMLIETGCFLGPLPEHFARRRVAEGKFREIRNSEMRWRSTFYLATRRVHVLRHAVELFAQDLQHACRGGSEAPD
ncbi:LysR family transcriptional regulator [Leisingera daeponensis]|uniref:LysR family transcriptional regulator n=1 Tax=Leisingera daeponensis TaxID=405746 RepID=A0ABS7NGZ6_9RHOB|nr:LysR family transcriptional regulator [Leisingera daeponensis]MBY6059106.1 LysR family transcriptional regulator [Leisingera daeponensis]MBY6140476.1 LysR family transcriptional regulator [Leisingera daeponensis]